MRSDLLHLYRFCFARPQLARFHHHLFTMALRGLGVLNAEGPAATGEAWLMAQLQKKIPVKTLIDVGANLDVLGVQEFPHAHIIACEPHPVTFARLSHSYPKRHFPHVQLLQVALGERRGRQRLWDFADDAELKHTQPTSTLASLDRGVIENLHGQKAQGYPVEVETIDHLMKKMKLTTIDFLKIDTEGFEYRVLKGAAKSLAAGKINIILFEFNEMNVYQRVFMRDFIELLEGFTFYRLLPSGVLPLGRYRPLTHEVFGFQNIVAVKNGVHLF